MTFIGFVFVLLISFILILGTQYLQNNNLKNQFDTQVYNKLFSTD